MLILTRKAGEILRIGDDIEITVLEIDGRQVRIGIKAPKEVSVHREEIYWKIQLQGEKQSKDIMNLHEGDEEDNA